ncbi:hypothetical protein GCM10023187_07710 [Nibrella viscosa]|uniref:Uncharacterized protein n=1 Tax=Nibrella viscosa TaxID=1084524 RepID=A0ABP8JXZ6_9BACT
MNELNDDMIQQWLDDQRRGIQRSLLPEEDAESARLYQQLFDQLSSEPSDDLSLGFSAGVVWQIKQHEWRVSERKAYILLGLGILLIPTSAFIVMMMFNPNALSRLLDALAYRIGPVLFGILLFVGVQWADHVLVKADLKRDKALDV